MKILDKLFAKKIFSAGAALLIAASAGPVYAEEGDKAQTRTQERTRTELNLQLPGSDFGQSRNREEHTLMNQDQNQTQNQYQHQYKYMNKYQKKESNSDTSSTNRMNTANRYMQGSAATGSMNRQNTASRPMSAGRR